MVICHSSPRKNNTGAIYFHGYSPSNGVNLPNEALQHFSTWLKDTESMLGQQLGTS